MKSSKRSGYSKLLKRGSDFQHVKVEVCSLQMKPEPVVGIRSELVGVEILESKDCLGTQKMFER